MPYIPIRREIIGSLELVYVETRPLPINRVQDLSSGKVYSGRELYQFSIFGAILERHNPTGLFPCPLFCSGKLNGEKSPAPHVKTRYHGLVPKDIRDDCLNLKRAWESEVDLMENGGVRVCHGQGCDMEAVIFSKPITFDLAKTLVFIRNPNSRLTFSGTLAVRIIPELFDGFTPLNQEPYQLVYIDLEDYKRKYSFAINGHRLGIIERNNPHLTQKEASL